MRDAGFQRTAGPGAQNDRLCAQRFLGIIVGHASGEQSRNVFLQLQLQNTVFRTDAHAAGGNGCLSCRKAAQPDQNAQPECYTKKKKQILFHKGVDLPSETVVCF